MAPPPRTALIITGGLFLGASATARQVGEIFLLPALAYLLVAAALALTALFTHRRPADP